MCEDTEDDTRACPGYAGLGGGQGYPNDLDRCAVERGHPHLAGFVPGWRDRALVWPTRQICEVILHVDRTEYG
jgi:hypothetical protein